MGAPLAKQVLLAIGGDVATKYGTAVWRKGLQARGGETAYSFSRSGNGLYLAQDVAAAGLKVFTAGANQVRLEQLVDPVTGVLQSYLKLEAAATNSCLQSQALATTWVPTTLTATNNAAAAPDGTTTATNLIPDTSSTSGHRVNQSITVTANEFCAMSGFFQATGYSGLNIRFSDAGGTNFFGIIVDVTAGTFSTTVGGGGSVSGSTVLALANGWYWVGVWGSMGGGVTAGGIFANVFDTYAHAQTFTAYAGNGTSGIRAWGLQLERNGSNALPPTSYIPTTTTTATRNQEQWQVAQYVPVPAAGLWRYSRFVERGTFTTGSLSHQHLVMGNNGPRWMLLSEAGSLPRVIWNNGVTEVRVTAAAAPTFGQVFETLETIDNAGLVTLRTSINGAADSVATVSGGAATGASFDNFLLQLESNGGGSGGYTLLSRALLGTGAVSQIADVRNAL